MKTGLKGLFAVIGGFVIIGVVWTFISSQITDMKTTKGEEKMKLNSITANLMVRNVNETIDYYINYFGFEVAMTKPEQGEYDWAMIVRDSVQLMLQKRESLEQDLMIFKDKPIGGSFTLFIGLNGVQQLYNDVKGKVEIVDELKKTFYGMKEFTVKDINGYILTFAERIENDQ